MPHLLIELGTEELPLSSLDLLYEEVPSKAEKILKELRLPFESIKFEATPRRIALFVAGIAKRQADQVLELSGPQFEKAYDPAGKPTAALHGFLKSKGASLKEVKIKETPKGRFISLEKKETGKLLASVLPAFLENVFSSLNFAKQMRWESSGFRFPRPVRWLAALLDTKVLKLKFTGIQSGAVSYGHRFLSPHGFRLKKADWQEYEKMLKKHHVILSLEKRKDLIRNGLTRKFDQTSIDEDLVHLNAQLVEEPFLIKGKFSKTYLDLPPEVLTSCMKKNQKTFICHDGKGRVSGHFVAVLNGKRNGLGKICEDFENVLESRLKDAQFFYREDTKTSLEKKVSKLEQVTYLGKLGNLAQKTDRLVNLSGEFATLINRQDLAADAKRAARLAKADLITHLVYEFPDLQGIAGREYAFASGEKKPVAEAIGTQYMPKNLSEETAQVKKYISPLGALLGLADRLDLLTGAFAIGLEPTGSQDPYALKRAGGIFVKLIRCFRFSFSLEKAVHAAVDGYGNVIQVQKRDMTGRIKQFLKDRVIFELKVQAGSRGYEILQAVFRSGFDDLADVFARYEILRDYFENHTEIFLKTAKVVERTSNILKGSKEPSSGSIRSELLQEELEKGLYELIENKSEEIRSLIRSRDYGKATALFGESFYRPLHAFFDKILVNAEDKEIRSNRHALMKRINSLYTDSVADLSVLSRIDIE